MLISSAGAKGENYLAIFGGIGKDDRILCDIHFLNLDSLCWEEPKFGSHGIEQHTSSGIGEGPPLPGCKIYSTC